MLRHQDEYAVPESVRTFVNALHRAVSDSSLIAIADLYAIQYVKVTERFFKASPWPTAELVADLVDHDELFLILYKELYYRHLCNNRDCSPSVDDRIDAFRNYLALFNTLLDQSESDPKLQLPSLWLWDIVHEFVMQKFAFDELISAVDRADLPMLNDHPGAWALPTVLQYLHALVEKGRVPLKLNPQVTATDSGDKGVGISSAFRTLSYYSLIALSLVHCHLGDYHTALETLEPIDQRKRSHIAKIYTCFTTLQFVSGYASLMLHKFMDAIRTFSGLFAYAANSKSLAAHRAHDLSQGFVQQTSLHEQALALLTIAIAVCPNARIDESVMSAVKEDYGDELAEMENGSPEVVRRLFEFGTPSLFSESGAQNEPRSLRAALFLKEVALRQSAAGLDAFLKLYATIPIAKLAASMNLSQTDLIQQLLAHKQLGADSGSELDFQVRDDIVHVAYSKPPQRHMDFFARGVQKFNDLVREVERIS